MTLFHHTNSCISHLDNVSALAVTCIAYGISRPVRSFMYLDMLNIYMDVIRWKDLLNQDLNSFVELEILCSTMLEWRLAIYAMVFQIFWGSFLFRFVVIHFTQMKLFTSCFQILSHKMGRPRSCSQGQT